MGFIRALTDFAAATANLHPDHRARFNELAGPDRPRTAAESPAGHGDAPEDAVSSRRVG
jgi:hypothetical protein